MKIIDYIDLPMLNDYLSTLPPVIMQAFAIMTIFIFLMYGVCKAYSLISSHK